jgi:hypothetical protein
VALIVINHHHHHHHQQQRPPSITYTGSAAAATATKRRLPTPKRGEQVDTTTTTFFLMRVSSIQSGPSLLSMWDESECVVAWGGGVKGEGGGGKNFQFCPNNHKRKETNPLRQKTNTRVLMNVFVLVSALSLPPAPQTVLSSPLSSPVPPGRLQRRSQTTEAQKEGQKTVEKGVRG